ncbi:MAG: hypothetical protein FWD18_01865 [Micrococcales bacterium]|nr:hypothetical protein [Micrococcales bacterium]
MTLLQKTVSPRLSRAYLKEGYDRVGGFVVRVSDVRFATSTDDLAAVHGLRAPGSGWTPRSPWIDLLRFEADWYLRYLGQPGFAVPLWWLMHTRVPPGAQLIRRYAEGGTELLARYGHLGAGWRPADPHLTVPTMARLSQCVGPVAAWNGTHYDADVVDGRVVVATSTPQPQESGFWPGGQGRWYQQLHPAELTDVFGLEVAATWRGMPVHVVDQVLAGDRQVARIVPAGDNVEEARQHGMTMLDVDVLEAWVLLEELDDLRSQRLDSALPDALRPPPTEGALPVPELSGSLDEPASTAEPEASGEAAGA